MKVLRAIGGFFARIGRWIRDTAWVQPLLIVGGIFAIIFSIPYISNWVKGWFVKTDAGEVYYKQKELSCQGAKEGTSQAEDLLTYMSQEVDPVVGYDYDAAKAKYGEKFFVLFGYEGCPGCTDLYPAFSTAANEWKSTFKIDEEYKFWFIDVTSVDTEGDSLFVSNADYSIYSKFSYVFEKAAKVGEASYYCKNTTDQDTYKTNCDTNGNAGDQEEFVSPTCYVVNMAADSEALDYCGIEQVFYTVPTGDLSSGEITTLAYIQFLAEAWTGKGVFSENKNDPLLK